MKEYLISCISAVAFFSLTETLLLKGAFNKILKSVISLVSILIIISPLINVINYTLNGDYTKIDVDYSNYLLEIEKRTTESEISSLLIKNGYIVNSVKVEIENESGNSIIKNIIVNVSKLGITETDEHIHIIDEIKKIILEKLYDKKADVTVILNGNE